MKKMLIIIALVQTSVSLALKKPSFTITNPTDYETAVKVYRLHPLTKSHEKLTPNFIIIKSGKSATVDIMSIKTADKPKAGDYHLHVLYSKDGKLFNQRDESGKPYPYDVDITIETNGQSINLPSPEELDEEYYDED